MSQYAFSGNTIINQSFPDTRTALNAAYAALASNSSGDNDPTSVAGGSLATVQHQWWYDSTNNKLMLRNDANNAWIEIATIDETSGNVLSITTQGLTIGATALTATGTEINQLSSITRGSILYGNSSGATARLAKGGAGTVLTSDGTDISWAAAGGGGATEFISTSGAISSAASVSFTGFDDNEYNNYFFMFNNVLPASADTLYCQTSTDGGSNFATTNGDYHRTSNTDATGMLVAENVSSGSPTTYGVSGRFELYQPTNADNYTYSATYVLKMDNLFRIQTAAVQTTLNYQNSARIAEEDNNAVRFLFIGGSAIASGEIAMYGIKKA